MLAPDVLLPVVAVVLFTVLIITAAPGRVESSYEWFKKWKRLFTSALLALVAITFIQSGDPVLFLLALVFIMLVTIYIFVERPDKEMI